MIFPQEELEKRETLNSLISEFLSLSQQYQFGGRYNEKLGKIISMMASKLVGCDDRISLTKSEGYYHSAKVLTRDGIKEEFGYDGRKAREPYGSGWIDAFSKDDRAIISFIHLTKSPLIQNKPQLEKVIQALLEVKQLPGNQGAHFVHKLNRGYSIQVNIEKEGDGGHFSCIEGGLGEGYNSSAIYLSDSSIKNSDNSYYGSKAKYSSVFTIRGKLSLVEYITVSEPDVYSIIVDKLKESIRLGKEQIEVTEAQYQKVLANYGEYLVIKEL